METIRAEIERGDFPWSRDLEDVHFNIEKRLTALVGDAGKRLHTGRSRNDQVATDLRLWLRESIDALDRRARRAAPRVHRARRSPRGHDHARIHASAGRAARHFRPSSARLRSDVRARRRALSRLPAAREPAAAGERGARGHELSDRPRARRRGARLRGALHELARRRVRPRFRRRIHGRRRLDDDPRVAVRRGALLVDESALRVRHAGRPLLHRLVDHAAEEESGRRGARARQDRTRDTDISSRCSRC